MGPDPDYSNVTDEHVPHEESVAEAIDAHMRRTSDDAALEPLSNYTIPTTVTPLDSASSSYVEAEADAAVEKINTLITNLATAHTAIDALVDRVNALTNVLVEAELLPEFED